MDSVTHASPGSNADPKDQHLGPAGHGHALEETHAAGDSLGHGGHVEKAMTPIDSVLATMGDHHEVDLGVTHLGLPYIFWDKDGFHFFAGQHGVEESQTYTLDHHKGIARKDGGPISFDLSITSNVFFMFAAAVIITILGTIAARKSKKSLVPSGIGNVMESVVLFVRDEVVYPNVERKYADKLMPFFMTVFFFILVCNLIGLVPLGHTATGNVAVTAALALCTFFVTQFVAISAMGIKEFGKHLTGGLVDLEMPLPIKILLILIMVPIEIVGLFTKPFALAVRLFANMTAGHVVVLSLIGLTFLFKSYFVAGSLSVPFALFIMVLELLVAFLQAYVFTMLSALFIGMGSYGHHGDDHAEHHDEKTEHALAH
jgi:F-type H+-transporting ATPase subunit a